MFGLSCFSGAPFSSYLVFSPTTSVSGLQADALLNSVIIASGQAITLTGVYATATSEMGDGVTTYPNIWTLINTDQNRRS
jgi:hypothetical protein